MAAGGDGRLLKILGAIVALITIAGGGVTLLFHLRPNLQPCIGAAVADFTGAQVFPRTHFHDYLFREGYSQQEIESQPNSLGAEVRLSFRLNNLKNDELYLYRSLVTVDADGEVAGVVPEEDRKLDTSIKAETCATTGGRDVFVEIRDRTKRYRVVLELFRSQDLSDRLALFETPTFHG